MRTRLIIRILLFMGPLLYACRGCNPPEESVIVLSPEEMDAVVSDNLKNFTEYALANNGKLDDSTTLYLDTLTSQYYQSNGYKSVWSSKEQMHPLADSLLDFVRRVKDYGLFPSEYHLIQIQNLHRRLSADSLAMKDAVLWTRLDALSTDAFIRLLKDLKESRMTPDSLSLARQKSARDSFFYSKMNELFNEGGLTKVLEGVQPNLLPYQNLQKLVPSFVKEMDTTHYDFIPFPDKDSLGLIRNVYSRLLKAGFADSSSIAPDSAAFATVLKRYQAKMGLEADGKLGKMTIGRLNQTDDRRFRMIALSLDKYRLRASMPQTYIWANIPSFRLDVWVDDTLRLQSRIVVGKPTTPTPTLVSGINNMVTFPIWTIPESIIKTEILPQLRKDPGYLARKGYNLFTNKGDEVDPFSVDWSKYKNGIPWRIIQGSGDDNALGIFKFNFNNPFSVYLHDTNQRYLFGNANRALSHGCVRVQKWRELADIIATRDSVLSAKTRLAYNMDSIKVWLGEGARKTIYMKNRFPLYIDYFTCDDNNGKLGFYDDIYNEDALLIEKYFTAK